MINIPDYLKNVGFIAVLTPALLFFQQIRDYLSKFIKLFWKERIIPDFCVLEFYKKISQSSFLINLDNYIIQPDCRYSLEYNKFLSAIFKLHNTQIFLYKNFIPIFVFGHEHYQIKIRYLKFTFNFRKFYEDILKTVYSISEENKSNYFFTIYEIKGKSTKSSMIGMGQPITGIGLNNINNQNQQNPLYNILNCNQIIQLNLNKQLFLFKTNNLLITSPSTPKKDKYQFTKQGKFLLNQVKKWLESEKWYAARNIPWKRGCLLYGKPGTGKSILVLEIAKKLDIPICIFDLSSLDNDEFNSALKNDIPSGGAILLFEDIDTIFNKRENINKNSVTFDFFINKLGGIKSITNKFIFITTNKIETCDEALIRPGRLDERIELLSLNQSEKLELAKTILDFMNYQELDIIVEQGKDDTTAEFENRCIRIALENHWNK